MKREMAKDVVRMIAIIAAFILLFAMIKAIELIGMVSSGDWTVVELLISVTIVGVLSAVSFYILMYARKILKPMTEEKNISTKTILDESD